MYISRSYNSSGHDILIWVLPFRSWTTKSNPLCILLSMTSPGVLNGSAKTL